ncbi:protein disulfide isomerase-like 5-4 [Rhododendron vialii]|uniref:protein disulfide isomerase-like 5-4 n=1 Tax=Rhododendron vialii TaxID=182163 RepID=UPI0026602639|nr:protein disulfide isomerase-like 5-4 [Rhododendron vialii]
MISMHKLKSVDFYRKIPRDLTEASLSGAGLSIIAALSMIFLFGMELSSYLKVSTATSVIVDKSSDGEFLRIDFNISFPALSCEFASVDVSDVLGTNRLNITKTLRKYPIDSNLRPTGSEYLAGVTSRDIKHDDEVDEEYSEDSVILNGQNFESVAHRHPILVVNFYAPWCYWSNRLKPSWEKAARIVRERYDPEMDGRIVLGKVDCTEQADLCRRHHIQGYPSIRIFRKGSDLREDHGQHDHESYHGDRDTDTLVKTMENLVAPIPLESQRLALENVQDDAKRPAPLVGGCRIEGFVRVKKVPGNLVISARSGAHSFDASKMNMSHIISHLSFGKKITPEVMRDMQRVVPYLGGSHDKLNGRHYITNTLDSNANVTIEHYLQIVKTEVITRRTLHEDKVVEEYEYTAHSSLVHSLDIPVAKFHFQLSPMQVLILENSKSFSHFITNVCAIIGGVFTVAGILDSILHNTMKFVKKVELGKNF